MVKVLDFGLAKAYTADPATPMPDTFATEHRGTTDRVILGTAAYMSPEQARGLAVDKRTDVWAFGCVLYELLTGRRAFDGPTLTDTMAAVLNREPDWAALPPTVSPRVRELLRRCLVKDPKRRLRDIGDALVELETPDAATIRSPLVTAETRGRERVWMLVAALATIAAIALAWSRFFATTSPPLPVSFTVPPPEGHTFPALQRLAMSPDGRHLAFVATANGKNELWVRSLDSATSRLRPGTEGAGAFVWSPDSRSIAFGHQESARLKRVDLSGGTPTTILPGTTSVPAWGSAGVMLLAGRDGRLYRVPERGGEPAVVVELDRSRQEINLIRPVFLPDGRRFIFQASSQDASKSAVSSVRSTARHGHISSMA